MLDRRQAVGVALATAVPVRSAPGNMVLALHQTTSVAAGYRKSLEGWARAGIRYAEIIPAHLEEFARQEGVPAAKRLLSDLNITPVASGGVRNLWAPGPARAGALEDMKRAAEMAREVGIDRMVCPCIASGKYTVDDYRRAVDNMREAGDIAKQFGMTLMPEFTRASTFIATLSTSLRMTREAAHPNVRPMLDCYHFWSGLSKFEDLALIRSGEIWHVHFQDVPDLPRELLDMTTREVPGDGISPLQSILKSLSAKGYSGPLSVELFYPKFQKGDPYEVARLIRGKAEAVMGSAGVL